jgi:hypothetical protein
VLAGRPLLRRRKFITLLCGAAAMPSPLWPFAARAQQSERMLRIGVLMPFVAGDPEAQVRSTVFAQTLQQLGWTVGRNVQIDYRLPAARPTVFVSTRPNWLHSHRM